MNRSPLAQGCGRPTRREFLRAGALALGGLTLADVLRARAAGGVASSETSVILFYMWGGPSHLETYDLKPDAPVEYRSVFRPIATRVPGMDICELFPRQAQVANRFSLVRSLNHEINIHNDAAIEVLTGKRPTRLDPTSQATSEHPDFGMIAAHERAGAAGAMPQYVALPNALHMTRPTYLGVERSPFVVGNPAAQEYAAPHLRLAAGLDAGTLSERHALVSRLDRLRRGLDQHASLEATDKFREQAFELLASPQVAEAFDLAREPAGVRAVRPQRVGAGLSARAAPGRSPHGRGDHLREHAGQRARVHQLGRPPRQRRAARPLRRLHAKPSAVHGPGAGGAGR